LSGLRLKRRDDHEQSGHRGQLLAVSRLRRNLEHSPPAGRVAQRPTVAVPPV